GQSASPQRSVALSAPIGANGPREHYLRGFADANGVHGADKQDSSLLSVLSQSNVLIVRPPNDPARNIGEYVNVMDI
ncbi:MAG: molybdopterin molybdenumtransferase MoeA, partial [Rhodobacteraceae bacterium]|nr:molybdopterin molybdenumtransferase MoeA [Paracoccaceae bacterium]